ncbi:MAG: DNA-3-methyladenine glycosylase I [Planctomycetota bacterium]|jgi:DNA-3-methyladenine glycosylase I
MTSTDPPAPVRCAWCGEDPLYLAYHDEEWGVPVRDDRHLFEMLTLEGAQAGLSWLTILRKREGYRRAFHGFELERVAAMDEAEMEALRQDPGIVRNRLKIASTVRNARALLAMRVGGEPLGAWLWSFVDDRPIQNEFPDMASLPAETELSKRISKELKKRGLNFVGPTIIYALMQATGMVNDHVVGCFRHREVAALGAGASA